MAQKPGSVYLGNLVALNHNVVHGESQDINGSVIDAVGQDS